MISMAFSISATLGFSGGSLASSGTGALQDTATGLAPSFPEWLKVFFEDCGNENEFVDSEKTFTEVSKTCHFPKKNWSFFGTKMTSTCTEITSSSVGTDVTGHYENHLYIAGNHLKLDGK